MRAVPSAPPPGWYFNQNGEYQWWTGSFWGPLAPQPKPVPVVPDDPVRIEPEPDVRAAEEPRSIYVVSAKRGRIVLLLWLGGFFILMSLFALVAGGVPGFFAGAIGIVLGILSIRGGVRMLRNSTLLTADVDGIHPGWGGLIEWWNLDAVGTFRLNGGAGFKAIGLRIKDVPAYAASLTDAEAVKIIKEMRTMKALYGAAIAVDVAGASSALDAALSALDNAPDAISVLTTSQRKVAGVLATLRRLSGGWDLSWGALTLTEKPNIIAARLEALRPVHPGHDDATGAA